MEIPPKTGVGPTPPGAERQSSKRKYEPRASQACHMCRIRKTKCNQGRPCLTCEDRGFDCKYADNTTPSVARSDHGDTHKEIDLASNQSSTLEPPHYQRHPRTPNVSRQHASLSSSGISQQKRQRFEWDIGGKVHLQQDGGPDAGSSPNDRNREADLDPVGDVNKHTSGMEFYGTSSNFAILSQLIFQARSRIPVLSLENRGGKQNVPPSFNQSTRLGQNVERSVPGSSDISNGATNIEARKILGESPLSVVELLFDENSEALDSGPDSGSKTPNANAGKGREIQATAGSSIQQEISQLNPPDSHPRIPLHVNSPKDLSVRVGSPMDVFEGYLESRLLENLLEKEYLHIFFNNLHHIHPFLSMANFTTRCEQEVWANGTHRLLLRHRMHFLALYYTTIAVGALTAGTDLFESFRRQSRTSKSHDGAKDKIKITPSSVDLSRIYFRRAKRLLGDLFEACSLESAQALTLMSLYCQNALKPHACYMYSGMAVRTALAIGLPEQCMSKSEAESDEAKKTWWAIYSQEVDMCCSSGRRSSLRAPQKYRIPFPEVKGNLGKDTVDSAQASIAMIPEMVRFASILLHVSGKIYHPAKDFSPTEKSKIALELDRDLVSWRSNLPPWLNPDSNPFRETEWAGKQKLVLQLRFYNAKILIHRPLMSMSTLQDFPELRIHTEACLEAARKTIDILYECYAHRHYFRTWWYNSTYTLYASMIILYVVLIDSDGFSKSELIGDVEKSLDILLAMEEANVARRCADLIGELLDIAKRHVKNNSTLQQRQDSSLDGSINPIHENEGNARPSDWSGFGLGSMPAVSHPDQDSPQSLTSTQNFISTWDRTRDDVLASIMDPVALEGFASDGDLSRAMNFGTGFFGMDSQGGLLEIGSLYDFPAGGYDESAQFHGIGAQGFADQW